MNQIKKETRRSVAEIVTAMYGPPFVPTAQAKLSLSDALCKRYVFRELEYCHLAVAYPNCPEVPAIKRVQ